MRTDKKYKISGSVLGGVKALNGKKMLRYFIGFVVVMAFFVAIYSTTVIGSSPKINPDNLYDYLYESSVLYDDDGKLMSGVYLDDGNRINVEYKQLPENLVNAIVAIEDKTFWKHHGFNIIRIFGAIMDSIFGGGDISGTSTVTQQLARNVYLADTKQVRSLSRKISEAWYTVQLEAALDKKQIMEAYLNTIYLGYNSYGVETASKAYFNKNVQDLNLTECAALAALPKSPDAYALAKTIDNTTIAEEAVQLKDNDVLYANADTAVVYNGDASEERRLTCLNLMNEQGYITSAQKKKASSKDLQKEMNLYTTIHAGAASYYKDYVIEIVTADLMDKLKISEEDAKNLIYTGGLRINTTLNSKAQKSVETEFEKTTNFPGVSNLIYDSDGNILSKEGETLLYDYDDYFDSDYVFTLKKNEFKFDKSGNMILKADKRLNFYTTEVDGVTDYSIDFNPLYVIENSYFYSIEGGTVLIPADYKRLKKNGDLVIDATFFDDYPGFFTVKGDTYSLKRGAYALKQRVRQPQGAMVISDYKNGAIKAMIGGRSTTGQRLYNRAINPHQPGSAIKPLSVYSSALQQGADAADTGTPMSFTDYGNNQMTEGYGYYWTAASLINDEAMTLGGKVWPQNWYHDFKGQLTMRESVEQSVNVNAVRVYQQVGDEYIVDQLKDFGITTVVDDAGKSANDLNPASLALGGMTEGISPLEMSAAYGTFPNKGRYIEPVIYTTVEDKNGKVLLESKKKKEKKEVVEEGVAFIMADILRTTVSRGIASAGATGNQVTGGKTGTTNDQYDVWFCGFTPQYSAALWIGNDVNIELSEGSISAAALWAKIMRNATAGMGGSMPWQPGSVIHTKGEYFVSGTQVGVAEKKEMVEGRYCNTSGYLATPWCPGATKKEVESEDEHSQYYCPVHNQDPEKYPVAPGKEIEWTKPDDEEPEEPDTPEDPENPTEPTDPTT